MKKHSVLWSKFSGILPNNLYSLQNSFLFFWTITKYLLCHYLEKHAFIWNMKSLSRKRKKNEK
jgi:hypothetical protein